MASTSIDRAQAGAGMGIGGLLATLSGVLLLILVVAFAALSFLEVVGRYGVGRPLFGSELSEDISRYFGLAVVGASLLALPAALAAAFMRQGDPPLRSRSALVLVPGCLVAMIAALAGFAVMFGMGQDRGVGFTLPLTQLAGTFGDYIFLVLPCFVVISAVIGGARTPEATAAVAAPTILVALYGTFLQVSIANTFVALLVPAIIAAATVAVLFAAAPARAVTPWLAGWALAFGTTLLVITGFLTPTEAGGLLALFVLVVAIPIRTLALGQPIAPMLRQAGMETVAIVAVMAAGTLVSTALALSGASANVVASVGTSSAALLAVPVAYLAAAYLLTPALAIALLLPLTHPIIVTGGIDPVLAGTVAILLGLGAAMARAARRDPAAEALSLPAAAAWIAAAVLVALAAVVALVPNLAMAPVRALLL